MLNHQKAKFHSIEYFYGCNMTSITGYVLGKCAGLSG